MKIKGMKKKLLKKIQGALQSFKSLGPDSSNSSKCDWLKP